MRGEGFNVNAINIEIEMNFFREVNERRDDLAALPKYGGANVLVKIRDRSRGAANVTI